MKILYLALFCAVTAASSELVFVHQVIRHGARAPIMDLDLQDFPVEEGFLTPEGMRERYLVGRYNRKRYSDFLSAVMVPGEVQIESTWVNRTIQSGYSELLGLYPPGSAPDLSPTEVESLLDVALPPFTVRNSAQLNQELGSFALPEDFAAIPLFNFMNEDIYKDDLDEFSCPFILKKEIASNANPNTFDDLKWMMDSVRKPVQESTGISDEEANTSNYHDFYLYTDTAVALDFEGYQVEGAFFSPTQWQDTIAFQKVVLVRDFVGAANELMCSRLLRRPLDIMNSKVTQLVQDSIDETDDLKFLIYSAHDTQIVNLLEFLKPTNFEYIYVPYASQIVFELRQDVDCMNQQKSETCFSVVIRVNGIDLGLPGCQTGSTHSTGCSYVDFKAYLSEVWYSGDLDQDCLQ